MRSRHQRMTVRAGFGRSHRIEKKELEVQLERKATTINLLRFSTPQMRAFHMTWFAFFLCFFAWFGIAPLMKVVRDEMSLTQSQVGWCIIGSVSLTVIARLFIGWLCDRIGPHTALMEAEIKFRRIRGYRDMHQLETGLNQLIKREVDNQALTA